MMDTRKSYILAIDQGTSSTKSIIFDEKGEAVAKWAEPLKTYFLENGFVEQEPGEIYDNALTSVEKCLEAFRAIGGDVRLIKACGISNQRETFVIWNEEGKPLHRAVVWQCKRSVQICERLKKEGAGEQIRNKTGLTIDPYFSGTKLSWLSENLENVRSAIDAGKAFFGTIDAWLLYKLTGGKKYCCDYTNASRTLFFNLKDLAWDKELLKVFNVQAINLPEVKPSSFFYGETSFNGLLETPLPITAMIGDSHAAAFGENCFEAGTAKATLGTGCSILMNTGREPVWSGNKMMTTICWSTEAEVAYALEGVIVSCGSTIEWLKNELNLFEKTSETEQMSLSVPNNGGVYLIPAFSGLGSPHWLMAGKAAITGLGFETTKHHIVRAALESIPYQVKDVVDAMEKDLGLSLKQLMINGGMTSNQFVMQFLADLLGIKIKTGSTSDVSALGAAYLAGLKIGVYKSMDALKEMNAPVKYYQSGTYASEARAGYRGWLNVMDDYVRNERRTAESLRNAE